MFQKYIPKMENFSRTKIYKNRYSKSLLRTVITKILSALSADWIQFKKGLLEQNTAGRRHSN